MLKRFQVTLFTLLFVLALSAHCGAAELVTNGGFETGSFSNWTVTPAAQGSVLVIDTSTPHAGAYDAAFGATRSQDDSISQTLATVPGQSYTFSFWLAHPTGRSTNDFSASWNGNPVLSLTNSLLFPYTQYSFTETAGAGATIISFSGLENPAYFYLDDVSVQGPQSVPEPISLFLFGAGLMGMTVIGRKTRKQEA
jgi:hypothetical protein